jgi:hypothetical protein
MTPRKSVTVPLPPDQAFDLFARRLPDWWPRGPRGPAGGRLRITPGTGGSLRDDRRTWARFTGWDPGRRLDMLWLDEGQPAAAITVTFTPVDTGTRVEVTEGARTPPGWQACLQTFAHQARLCEPA